MQLSDFCEGMKQEFGLDMCCFIDIPIKDLLHPKCFLSTLYFTKDSINYGIHLGFTTQEFDTMPKKQLNVILGCLRLHIEEALQEEIENG